MRKPGPKPALVSARIDPELARELPTIAVDKGMFADEYLAKIITSKLRQDIARREERRAELAGILQRQWEETAEEDASP
jgi:hypothetical protein